MAPLRRRGDPPLLRLESGRAPASAGGLASGAAPGVLGPARVSRLLSLSLGGGVGRRGRCGVTTGDSRIRRELLQGQEVFTPTANAWRDILRAGTLDGLAVPLPDWVARSHP